MSLLSQALESLDNNIELSTHLLDSSAGWLDKLLDKLGDLIDSTENVELREGGQLALQVIMENKEKFIGLGKRSFILFVANVAAGRPDEAAKEYYRAQASPRDIINAILDDAVDLEKLYREREMLKKQALDLVDILLTGAKFLLPLLLVAI